MTAGADPAAPERGERGLRARVALSLGLIVLLGAALGGWAANATLSGAIVAAGHVVVDSSVKKVQHPTGGVVGQLLVKNGDRVHAGDVLVRLDDTVTRANLAVIMSQTTELTGRLARLAAERDGASAIRFPDGFERVDAVAGVDGRRVAEGERRLFEVKRAAAEGKKAQLTSRIGQFRHEIAALTKQEKAKAKELGLIQEELERLQQMYRKSLVPVTRVLAIERDATRIEGEHGAILSQIARVGGQIHEAELQILAITETITAEAQKEHRDTEAKLAELAERRTAAEDALARVELRAPRSGTVHELAVHTVGGVIAPGETVMAIVPDEDRRAIEVRLAPADIDQVTLGQPAVIRFAAFNQGTTPELNGTVSRLAADLTKDAQTGALYYTARLSVAPDELAKLGMELVAGMPVDAFIRTGERTALSYFARPFTDRMARTFLEE